MPVIIQWLWRDFKVTIGELFFGIARQFGQLGELLGVLGKVLFDGVQLQEFEVLERGERPRAPVGGGGW